MLVSIVLLLICLYFLILTTWRPRNFPPGPTALPTVGNLWYLSLRNPLKDLERLRQTYGNVYSLFIGHKPAVIINGFKAIKEAMVTKAVDFAGRPQDLLINTITQKKGVILANYGLVWKEHRRFALMTLRNFGMGMNSMEDRIHGELHYIIRTLEESLGGTMSPHVLFHNAASNIICQVLFGTRYDYDDDFSMEMHQSITDNAKIVNGPWSMLYNSFPFIQNLPLPFQKVQKNTERMHTLIRRLMMKHKKTRVPRDPRDFVDYYLDEMDKRVDDSIFSEEQLCMTAQDLYVAGTDTTSNVLLAGFLYLTNNPQIQERCQQEIDRVLEGRSQTAFEDRHKMPYVQAVIHEIQRKSNIVPLSIFHCTTKDTEFMGYSLPKGTMVIENMASVLHEEGQWRFPHEFNPENFLNDKGEFIKPEAFIPFSAGPRVCLGEGLARMELFLILVTLLRKFKFIWPEDAGEPDFTPVFGVTLTPKPYHMKVQLRSTKD